MTNRPRDINMYIEKVTVHYESWLIMIFVYRVSMVSLFVGLFSLTDSMGYRNTLSFFFDSVNFCCALDICKNSRKCKSVNSITEN